jgi:hypothetical protein
VSAARSHGRGAVAGSTGAAAQTAAGDQPRGGPQALERKAAGGLAGVSAAVDPAEAAAGLDGASMGTPVINLCSCLPPVLLTNTETGGAPRHLPTKVGGGRIMAAAPYMPWKSSSLF